MSRPRYAARSRPNRGRAAEVRRDAETPTGIAADLERRATRRQDGCGPSAAASGSPIEIVRIVRAAVHDVVGLVRQGEFGRVGLPEQNRTGTAKSGNDGGVLFRNERGPPLSTAGADDPGGIEVVFDGHRNPVQRARHDAGRERGIGGTCLFEGLFAGYLNHSVQRRIDRLDPIEVSGDHLLRRNLLLTDRVGESCRRRVDDVLHDHSSSLSRVQRHPKDSCSCRKPERRLGR